MMVQQPTMTPELWGDGNLGLHEGEWSQQVIPNNPSKRYTVGFLFSEDRLKVALIRKNKPKWQQGRFNGIGGKLEPNESPLTSIVREFKEETGVHVDSWEHLAIYGNDKYQVDFFRAFSDLIYKVRTIEEEKVSIIPVRNLPPNLIFNLRWLIPLCLDHYIKPPINIVGA